MSKLPSNTGKLNKSTEDQQNMQSCVSVYTIYILSTTLVLKVLS